MLVADSVALGFVGGGLVATDWAGTLVPVGAGVYLLSGPIAHVARQQYGKAGVSLLARAGVPALTAIAIASGGCAGGEGHCIDGVVIGMVATGIVTSLLDDCWFAHEPRVPTAVQPALSAGRESVWLGARADF